ncbi:MAG: MarR family transcriptional regulator [Actinobacteria bacterium]|nr:MarR family transcriptional regulator [Actinomycetota bacterium]
MSRLLERASGDLSLAHYRVLAAVDDGEERASHVATRLALGKPTISATVDALCRRGYLVRDPAPDQRAATLRLTASGAAALAAAETAMRERFAAVLQHTERPADVVAGLGRLGLGLDRLAADRLGSRA